jgi:hypothetical protein
MSDTKKHTLNETLAKVIQAGLRHEGIIVEEMVLDNVGAIINDKPMSLDGSQVRREIQVVFGGFAIIENSPDEK